MPKTWETIDPKVPLGRLITLYLDTGGNQDELNKFKAQKDVFAHTVAHIEKLKLQNMALKPKMAEQMSIISTSHCSISGTEHIPIDWETQLKARQDPVSTWFDTFDETWFP